MSYMDETMVKTISRFGEGNTLQLIALLTLLANILEEVSHESSEDSSANKKEKTNLIKLAKYLKPFIFSLILAILLLFVQAMTNLKLPDYMSDIVNVGIQQNGVEHAAPRPSAKTALRS